MRLSLPRMSVLCVGWFIPQCNNMNSCFWSSVSTVVVVHLILPDQPSKTEQESKRHSKPQWQGIVYHDNTLSSAAAHQSQNYTSIMSILLGKVFSKHLIGRGVLAVVLSLISSRMQTWWARVWGSELITEKTHSGEKWMSFMENPGSILKLSQCSGELCISPTGLQWCPV